MHRWETEGDLTDLVVWIWEKEIGGVTKKQMRTLGCKGIYIQRGGGVYRLQPESDIGGIWCSW